MTDEQRSNVVLFRPTAPDGAHPFEVVQIFRNPLAVPPVLWISLAGPHSASRRQGRIPYRRVACFPGTDTDAAIRCARHLAAEFGIPIVYDAGLVEAGCNDDPRSA